MFELRQESVVVGQMLGKEVETLDREGNCEIPDGITPYEHVRSEMLEHQR